MQIVCFIIRNISLREMNDAKIQPSIFRIPVFECTLSCLDVVSRRIATKSIEWPRTLLCVLLVSTYKPDSNQHGFYFSNCLTFCYVLLYHFYGSTLHSPQEEKPVHYHRSPLTLILRRSRTGTVWFYTSTSNKRAERPKMHIKSLTRDLKLMYSRLTLVRISINL